MGLLCNSQTLIDTSFVRLDNDYVAYKSIDSKKEVVPLEIKHTFEEILDKEELSENPYSYKIKISNDIFAYILINNNFIETKGYIIFFNKEKKKVSKTPIIINLKWAYNNEEGFGFKLLDYPLFQINKENNINYVILKERVHNGNSYNAVVTRVYELRNDLYTELKFYFESKVLLDDGNEIVRYLKENKILSYLQKRDKTIYLGTVFLNSKMDNIESISCDYNDYCDVLITSSGIERDKFFKNGYIN